MTTADMGLPEFRGAANQANAVTGIYGISGSGKSNLADTAIEYAWETFGKISLVYAADLGGFGNKRLALIRAGIAKVWDPRNHIQPFATMELMSLGAWPEVVVDPERGYADPHVALILPRTIVTVMYCPQGHVVAKDQNEARLSAMHLKCPTCGTITNFSNAGKVEKVIVKSKLFTDVGFRVYDSFTSLNEWGMQDLQEQSARGTLPSAGERGGSLLGAADALKSGEFVFGSSSVGQYGFLQNRTYGRLANIRKIPEQVVPAVATFHVEQSKGDETTGGEMLYGPKIAGNARTGAMGGWLGNCLHATKEPFAEGDPRLVFRLWLTNHIDPRDLRKVPYIAKHRGTPLGMPSFLEDKPGDEPWSGFSLKVLFTKLQAQLDQLEAQTKAKYPNAPAWRVADPAAAQQVEEEEVLVPVPVAALQEAPTVVSGGRTIGRRGRRGMVATVTEATGYPTDVPSPATPVPPPPPVSAGPLGVTAAVGDPNTTGLLPEKASPAVGVVAGAPAEQTPLHVQQLEASVAAITGAATPAPVETAATSQGQPLLAVGNPAAVSTGPIPLGPRIRRVPRPPAT